MTLLMKRGFLVHIMHMMIRTGPLLLSDWESQCLWKNHSVFIRGGGMARAFSTVMVVVGIWVMAIQKARVGWHAPHTEFVRVVGDIALEPQQP